MKCSGMSRTAKCFGCCLIYLFVLFLLLFIIVFLIVPIAFKFSIGIQRGMIFESWIIPPKNYTLEAEALRGVRNFYVTVNQELNITLGLYHYLPQAFLREFVRNEEYDYESALRNPNYTLLLFLHGNGGDRLERPEMYDLLRNYFQILAVDYRNYADSTKAEINELTITEDLVSLYKWIKTQTNETIFVWGHSLGTGIGTQLLHKLSGDNISPYPAGLVLESPFSSIIDVVELMPIFSLFSWLPWGRATILHPIVENHFNFNSSYHINYVDCPVMILHAKDDTIIPYQLADKLFAQGLIGRNQTAQGNITYHLFEALGYDHMELYRAKDLPFYIQKFVNSSLQRFNKVF